MDLNKKTVLLTGASRGLGAATMTQLLAEGAIVYGASRDPSTVSWPKGVMPVALDMSSPSTLKCSLEASVLSTISIDVLINNAGAGAFASFEATNPDIWDKQCSLMLRSPIALCHYVLPKMVSHGTGVIVNVSSLAVEYPIPYMSGYNAAKSGLSSFSQTLMSELKNKGVSVIDFRPGDFNSSFSDSMEKGEFSEDEEKNGAKVWKVMEERMAQSPKPEAIAQDLVRAILRGRSGIVRSGSFFQRSLAPLYSRLVPSSWQRVANERYYKLTD
ncbi:SDR family NAD(P)-dependent oxidoreductase [Puniceicoccaceae bacterium K14]|nr:SDR family NAD(P)-dependent oxidoreductase [Puniceicoccaceae bacterium K14]